jgi:hypothetical protein
LGLGNQASFFARILLVFAAIKNAAEFTSGGKYKVFYFSNVSD